MNWKAARIALENELKDAEYGKIYSYEELSSIAGVDVKKQRHILETTKRCLLRHHNRLLASLRGQGYSICEPNLFYTEARASRLRAQNSTKRAYEICRAVPLDKLTEEERKHLFNEEARNGCLLVTFKVLEKRELDDKTGSMAIPTDSEVIRALLDKKGNL